MEVFALYDRMKRQGADKQAFLKEVVKIEGVYVPSFYDVSYHEDGTVAAVTPKHGAPEKVRNELFPIWEVSIIQSNLLFHLQKLCMTEPWKKFCVDVFGAVDSVRLGLSIVHFGRNQRRLSVGRQSNSAGIRAMTNFPCHP